MNFRHAAPFFTLATLFALSLCAGTARGQSRRDQTLRQRNAETMREVEIRQREGMLRTSAAEAPKSPALAFQQNKEDFRHLQVVHNQMMRATFAAEPARAPDYRHISKSTAEIGKRATRLKTNLQLPKPDREEQRQRVEDISSDAKLKASLLALDRLILSFVNNPAFRNSGTIDAQQSVKAHTDLVGIIELCRAVKSGAERLERAAK
jgi:hypothetical protein